MFGVSGTVVWRVTTCGCILGVLCVGVCLSWLGIVVSVGASMFMEVGCFRDCWWLRLYWPAWPLSSVLSFGSRLHGSDVAAPLLTCVCLRVV